MMSDDEKLLPQGDYKFGFQDKEVSVSKTQQGLSETTVREISEI